jgi:hypothetical protein
LIDYQALSTLHHLQKLCNLVGVTSSGAEEEGEEGEKDGSGHLDFRANIRKFNALLAQTPKYQALLTLVADSLPNIPTTEVRYRYLPFLNLRYGAGTYRHCCGSRIWGLVHFWPVDPGNVFPDPGSNLYLSFVTIFLVKNNQVLR